MNLWMPLCSGWLRKTNHNNLKLSAYIRRGTAKVKGGGAYHYLIQSVTAVLVSAFYISKGEVSRPDICINMPLYLKLLNGGTTMRPLITHDEIELLKRDLDTLGEQNLVGIEAYEALHLLEMRRQTAKLEFIKRALEAKEQ